MAEPEPARPGAAFTVETVHLDLPALAGALCRRLRDAGVPMTPGRPADLARALALVRPVSRRRLYWTARAVLVTDPLQVPAFDGVFLSVFGGAERPPHESTEEIPMTPAPADDRPPAGPRGGAARRRGGAPAAR